MPRSIWNGTIMLGRIPVAVKVYSATEDHTIHFHQVHAADGERLHQRRIASSSPPPRPTPSSSTAPTTRGRAMRMRGSPTGCCTMRFADELVDPGSLDVPRAKRGPGKREMAGRLVDSLHERFDPGEFHDEHQDRVRELIGAKARGETPTVQADAPKGGDADLMAALEASLAGSKG